MAGGEHRPGRRKVSAGLLMYRVRESHLEVFVGHPGGPLFARKDDGHWTIPKGQLDDGEEPLAAAIREFREETGLTSSAPYQELGTIRQRSGKVVYGWAFRGDHDDTVPIKSNLFSLEWPPQLRQVPELSGDGPRAVHDHGRGPQEAQRRPGWHLVDRLEAWGGWAGLKILI